MLDNIARLQAEEAIGTMQTVAVGSGTMPETRQRVIINSWRSAVQGEKATDRRSTSAQIMQFAQSAGVRIRRSDG